MPVPNINIGQVAIDPTNKVFYFKKLNGDLVSSTLDLLQDGFSSIVTSDNVTISANLTVTGDLTVTGTTTTINTENVTIEDNILILNSNVSATPNTNAGIEIERGTFTNVQIRWNETTDTWQYTNDGTTFYDINSIIANSVQLGYHTTGDYVEDMTAGTGVTITSGTGEGSNPTISIGQDVSTSATPTFGRVIAPITGNVTGNVIGDLTGGVTGNVTGNVTGDLTGNVTGNLIGNATGNLTGNVTGQISDISNHGINALNDVNATPNSGEFLKWNGSSWVNDPINLATDTIGDYISNLTGSNGITITNNSGENATPNIAFSGSIDNISDITITSAQNGQILEYDGTAWVNTVRPSFEPMGFENADDSSITFSNSTREFTISPASSSFTIWSVGKRYVKTTSESISLPNLSNLYYIYYNTSGALAYKTTFFTLSEDTPVAYIYWNQTDGVAHFIADERHGVTLDWATHEYLHRTRGAAIANGFGANNYDTEGNGDLDSHAQIDIAEGTFFDEDLRIVITNSATPSVYSHQQTLQGGGEFPVFYRTNSHYRRDTATKFPMKIGSSRVTYNLFSGGLWSTPDIDNNKFGISYLVATNDLNDPIFAIMGQAQYTDQGSAEAASWDSMNMSDFPVAEFRLLYKLIYQTSSTYTNTPKAHLTGVQDLRVSFISGGNLATVPVSDHGTMTGLSDDDHQQYLNITRHDIHDHTNVMSSVILDDISDVAAATPSSGDYLKWNGSAWISDPINLATDTVGNYMVNVSAGTGISVSHTQGEGSTATVSLNANLNDLNDVVISGVPTTNHVLLYNGSSWVSGGVPGGLSSASSTSEGVVYGKTTLSGGTVFLGYASGNASAIGSNNIAIGEYSQAANSMGAGNVSIGYGSLRNSGSNNYSVAIGYTALEYASGGYNIGIGYNSLRGTFATSTGGSNIAIGESAGYSLVSGTYNIFMGSNSGYGITTSNYNIGIGRDSLKNVSGNANVAIGDSALSASTSLTGTDNIAIGQNAGGSLTSGTGNIFIGRATGYYNTSGSYNIFIGYNAGDSESGSNKLYIANSNTSSPLIKGDFSSSTVEINGSLTYRQAFNNQGTNTSVYLVNGDKGKIVTFNSSSNVTVYVNTSTNLVAGERIDILNLGSGIVSISASGVTVNATPGLKLRAQYSGGSLICMANNSSYVLIGDLMA